MLFFVCALGALGSFSFFVWLDFGLFVGGKCTKKKKMDKKCRNFILFERPFFGGGDNHQISVLIILLIKKREKNLRDETKMPYLCKTRSSPDNERGTS